MSGWVFSLILVSALCHATWNIAAKKVSRNIATMWLALTFTGLFTFVFYPSIPRLTTAISSVWPYLFISILIHNIYMVLLFRAYTKTNMSVVYPIGRGTGVLVSTLITIVVLNDPYHPIGIAGILLIFLGIACKAFEGLSKSSQHISLPDVGNALAIGSLIGSYLVIDSLAVKHIDPWGYIALTNLGMILTSLPLMVIFKRQEIKEALISGKRYIAIMASGMVASYGIFLFAVQIAATTSYVIALRESSVIMVGLYALFVLKEKISKLQKLGIFFIFIGAIAIKLA